MGQGAESLREPQVGILDSLFPIGLAGLVSGDHIDKHLGLGQLVRQLKVESKAFLAVSLLTIKLASDWKVLDSSLDQLLSFENRLLI